jgi:hypothetical protein
MSDSSALHAIIQIESYIHMLLHQSAGPAEVYRGTGQPGARLYQGSGAGEAKHEEVGSKHGYAGRKCGQLSRKHTVRKQH